MKITIGERLKGYVGKLFLGSIFICSMVLFFILYPLISEPDYYKTIILDRLNEQSGLSLNYQSSEPTFFPFPGITLRQVTVSKRDHELIRVEKLNIEIYFGIFLGRPLDIRSISLNTGKIEIKREKDESFPILAKFLNGDSSETESSDVYFSTVFGSLPHILDLKNISIEFEDALYDRMITFYIWESRIDLDEELQSINISLYGKLNGEIFQLYTDLLFTEKVLSYESLRFEGSIDLVNFSGNLLKDISVIFPFADLRSGRLNAKIPFYKRSANLIAAKFDRARIQNLALVGQKPFGDAYITVTISYDILTSKLSFEDIAAEWKGFIRLFGAGYVTFDAPPLSPTISFEGRSDYIDADSIIKIIKLWLDPDLEKSLLTRGMPSTGYSNRMNIFLNFNLKKANLRGILADTLNFSLHYQKSQMKIKKLDATLYGGIFNGTGSFYWGSNPRLVLSGRTEGINVEEILQHQFQTAPITGTLDTNYALTAFGNTEKSLIETMNINADFICKKGELLSYTNILKPISSIGSLISLKKIDFNKSTPYNEITMTMLYGQRKIQFDNFVLKADGLSANGSGDIDLDKKINMKFTIALPGVAGRALKLPIIYKGIYGVSTPYIDPIWLGSVYAGALFLAGPAGATVGGIAGSAASDYVDRAIDSVTETVQGGLKSLRNGFSNLFSREDNKSFPQK